MAHELTTNAGKTEMFYTGDAPWHMLGTALDHVATAKEAIFAAGMDWGVEKYPVFWQDGDGMHAIGDKRAIIRGDTRAYFSVMGDGYTPVSNSAAFYFFDRVVGAGEATYHTAGSLNGGKRIWILAKLNGELAVTNKDVLEKYILLANSHDGSQALTMMFTPVRVVCSNTLRMAMGHKDHAFYARHTERVFNRALEAREVLGLAEAYFANFEAGAARLVAKQLKSKDLEEMLRWVIHIPNEEAFLSDLHKTKQYAVDQITALFEKGRGNDMPGVKGTAWAAYNAVTEFVDYYRPAGKGAKTAGVMTAAVVDKRLNSAWFGSGSTIKERAWEHLLAN